MKVIYAIVGWLVFIVLALAISGIFLYNVEQKAIGERTNRSFWTGYLQSTEQIGIDFAARRRFTGPGTPVDGLEAH